MAVGLSLECGMGLDRTGGEILSATTIEGANETAGVRGKNAWSSGSKMGVRCSGRRVIGPAEPNLAQVSGKKSKYYIPRCIGSALLWSNTQHMRLSGPELDRLSSPVISSAEQLKTPLQHVIQLSCKSCLPLAYGNSFIHLSGRSSTCRLVLRQSSSSCLCV